MLGAYRPVLGPAPSGAGQELWELTGGHIVAHARRRALAGLLATGLLVSLGVGSAAATGSTSITICYDAANTQVVIHQTWTGVNVDEVQGGIGGKRGGLGFDNTSDGVPATAGDETDSLPADPHAKTVGGSLLYQGTTVDSLTINKIKGSWAKTLPAC